MRYEIIAAALLIAGGLVGYTYGMNTLYEEGDTGEDDLYSENKSFEINSSNPDQDLSFDNNSLSTWYNDGKFYLDINGDGSDESEVSENETEQGEFVRDVVRGDKAYQVYFRYEEGEDGDSASLEVYRVRQI